MRTEYGSNIWLISNSSIYFADSLINKDKEVNPFNLFDLSKISEAILLSDEIRTLPGYNNNNNKNHLFDRLKKEKILKEITISTKTLRADIQGISSAQDKLFYPRTIIDNEFLDKTAQKICDIIGIKKKEEVKNFIVNVSQWTDQVWNTPNLNENEWLQDRLTAEDSTWEDYRRTDPETITNIEEFNIEKIPALGNIVAEIYLRSILYLFVASDRGLTYYPDSIRAPIVEHLHTTLEVPIFNFVQNKLKDLEIYDEEIKTKINEIIKAQLYDIKIPACLSYILGEGVQKEKFIDKAFELRNSGTITKFRRYLTECERAIRYKNPKDAIKKINEMDEILLSQPLPQILKQNLTFKNFINNIPKSDQELALLGVKGLGKAFKGMHRFIRYFWKPRTIFYKNLLDEISQITSINSLLHDTFKSSLSREQIDYLKRLNTSSINYLNSSYKIQQSYK